MTKKRPARVFDMHRFLNLPATPESLRCVSKGIFGRTKPVSSPGLFFGQQLSELADCLPAPVVPEAGYPLLDLGFGLRLR